MLAAAPFIVFSQLQPIQNFGSNPGNLDMYLYAPPGAGVNAPLVVAMHGCTQTASQFAQETGWNSLADTYGFYVIYPEQKAGNNSSRCFNWFETGDINRDQGEARSIKAMADYVAANYSVDEDKLYVTGFSAGGGMTSVMLAAYPDIFSGGAIMSGLPYKAAIGLTAAFTAMNSGVDKSPQQWGDLARSQNSAYNGPWPRVAVFHGTSDYTVTVANVPEIVEQWTNLHSADATADAVDNAFDGNASVKRRAYKNGAGSEVVVTYEVSGMGHAVAIDPGANTGQGGQTGAYATDVNLYSCYRALEFWGLAGGSATAVSAPSSLSAAPLSSSSIRLNWTDNADNETEYVVERSPLATSGFAPLQTLPANTGSYTDQGLNPNTTYYYRVKAVASGTSSSYSNIAEATTDNNNVNVPPAAPSGLQADAASSSQGLLNWADNADNESAYLLERSEGGNNNYVLIASLPPNTTSFLDEGLQASTTYYYRLRASNGAGNSPYSNEASLTTDAAAAVTIIEQPQQQGWIAVLNLYDSGQSFTLAAEGFVTQIDVLLYNAVNGSTLRIFEGNTTLGSPVFEQGGISLGNGWQSITLSNPPNLDAGQYTFELSNSVFGYTFTDTYAGGNLWHNGFAYPFFDAAFRIYLNGGALTDSRNFSVPEHKIFPNPATDWITVEGQPNAGQVATFSLINSYGQLIRNEVSASGQVKWDVSGLEGGLYFVSIQKEGRQEICKLLVE